VAALICGVGAYLFGDNVDRHFAVQQWLVWRLMPIWGYLLLFNFACVAFGAFLLRKLLQQRELPALEALLQSMMLGLTAFVLSLYVCGFARLFRPAVALTLPLVFLIIGFRDAQTLWGRLRQWRAALPRPKPVEQVLGSLAVLGGGAALVFLYLEALDVSNINFDATWYHYPIAQDYARAGRIIPFWGDAHRSFPHLTSMLHTWALLVPGLKHLPQHWMLSLHLEYGVVLWRIVGVAALARWALGGRDVRGLWAGFFLFPSIFIYDQSIGASADHFLGFFAAPALLAAARALKFFDVRWCVLLGVALGSYVLVKYQAIYLLGGIGVIAALRLGYLLARGQLRKRRDTLRADDVPWRGLLAGAGAIALTATLVSAPHFGKNAVFHRNPTYPFAQSIFKASYPKQQPGYYREEPYHGGFMPKYSGLKRQQWALGRIFAYSFETANRNLTERRPYMGALFSLLLPCLLLVRHKRRLVLTSGVLFVAFWLWANTAPNDRYLVGFYDLCIGAGLALMVKVWDLGVFARVGLVPLVALQLFWGGDAMLFYGRKELEKALDLIAAGYKGKFDDRFEAKGAQRQITEATPPNAVILARNYKGLLGLDRTVLGDGADLQDYIRYSRLEDPRAFYEVVKARGVTHLLYPHGQRLPERLNNVFLFDELFMRHAVKLRRFGSLRLAELPAQAPPPNVPYLVLVSGIREYPDGIYAVEQLDIDKRVPNRFSPPPKPRERLSKTELASQLDKVNGMAIGRGKLPKAPSEALAKFESVERFSGVEVYLRRVSGAASPKPSREAESPSEPRSAEAHEADADEESQ
jgi:hypothetical protein